MTSPRSPRPRAAADRASERPAPPQQPRAPASGTVIFSLTETQASALLALQLGARVRAESIVQRLKLIDVLRKKGLVTIKGSGDIVLTPLGSIAVALCANLALDKVNGRAHGGES